MVSSNEGVILRGSCVATPAVSPTTCTTARRVLTTIYRQQQAVCVLWRMMMMGSGREEEEGKDHFRKYFMTHCVTNRRSATATNVSRLLW